MRFAQQDSTLSIERLLRHDDVSVQQLGQALRYAYNGEISAEEEQGVGAIERLRAELAESSREVSGFDYGAGSSSEARTRKVSRQGVWSTFAVGRDLTLRFSLKPPWTHLILSLVRILEPKRCLELGTCIGLSAAYQCTGLEMNGFGFLVTLEGNGQYARLAERNLAELGLTRFRVVVGRFEDTLPGVLRDFGPLDFVFNDGHHDGSAVVDYFYTMLPFLSSDAVLLFDDIRWSDSMYRGWQTVTDHPQVRTVVDLDRMGLCRLGHERRKKFSVSGPAKTG